MGSNKRCGEDRDFDVVESFRAFLASTSAGEFRRSIKGDVLFLVGEAFSRAVVVVVVDIRLCLPADDDDILLSCPFDADDVVDRGCGLAVTDLP